MFTKIDVLQIVRDHLFTLTGSGEKREWKNIWPCDLVLFYGIPLVAGVLLALWRIQLTESIISVGLVALTIFVPLLINVIFLIHTILDQLRNREAADEESKRKRTTAIVILKESVASRC